MENWQIPNRLQINFDLEKRKFSRGEIAEIPIEIENPTKYSVDFNRLSISYKIKGGFLNFERDYVVEM